MKYSALRRTGKVNLFNSKLDCHLFHNVSVSTKEWVVPLSSLTMTLLSPLWLGCDYLLLGFGWIMLDKLQITSGRRKHTQLVACS